MLVEVETQLLQDARGFNATAAVRSFYILLLMPQVLIDQPHHLANEPLARWQASTVATTVQQHTSYPHMPCKQVAVVG